MGDVIIPSQVKLNKIIENKYNLSPSNYRAVSIKNENQVFLKDLLSSDDTEHSFIRGIEPGSSAYLNGIKSKLRFIRNSCVNDLNINVQIQKSIFLNPKLSNYSEECILSNGDIVLSTDANIGDVGFYFSDNKHKSKSILSSGMVKLNLKQEINSYYVFAMLKDTYFRDQLNAMTPKGSTIRHSGSKFLECRIPIPARREQWVINLIEIIVKNISCSESRAISLQAEIKKIYSDFLRDINLTSNEIRFNDLKRNKRVDAGFYSEKVTEFFNRVSDDVRGNKKLSELGYKIRRGPNLAKRDLGRSIKTKKFHKNYARLVYPSDISEYGYINETTFLGASGKIWTLKENDILFSGEGNVGKTFAICDNSMEFTTNFHGIIITPIDNSNVNIYSTVLICTFLNYMREMGIMDKLTVGGQGGSFAVQYWDILRFPKLPNEELERIKQIYYSEAKIDPFCFSVTNINSLGIFEINKLISLSKELLDILINDIKNGSLGSKSDYIKIFQKNTK